MNYYYNKVIENLTFSEAIKKTTEELKNSGFGIITEIDLKKTFKTKLDVDFKNYIILGACNPNFAYQAIQKENKIGLLLPCNIVVEEVSKNKIEISAIDPIKSMEIVKNKELLFFATEIKKMLNEAIDKIN